MSLDHVGLRCPPSLYPQFKSFYTNTLLTLGYTNRLSMDDKKIGTFDGFGAMQPTFWIGADEDSRKEEKTKCHVAFAAKSREDVVKWYNKCIEMGGKDNGKPGLRPHYHRFYYGAFIIDPMGNNIEACNHFDIWALLGVSRGVGLSAMIMGTVGIVAMGMKWWGVGWPLW